MGGANLELFRFAFYLFFPVAALFHYGNPEWYNQHVLPYREKMLPSEERMTKNLPTDHTMLQQELARIKAEKVARRERKEDAAAKGLPESPLPDPLPKRLV